MAPINVEVVSPDNVYTFMTSREFFFAVKRMRAAQSDYFRNRTQQNLRRAKALESEVDNEIARVVAILNCQEEEIARNS